MAVATGPPAARSNQRGGRSALARATGADGFPHEGLLITHVDDNAENTSPAMDVSMAAAVHAVADPGTGAWDRATPVIHTSAAVQAVLHELLPQFDGELPASVVRDYVTQAAADLQGSISREAVPEMVIRLAAVRLERHPRPDQPTEETHDPHLTVPNRADHSGRRSDPAGQPFTLLR